MRTPARTGLLVAALAGALTLTACGGATVEDGGTAATSVAPLDRAPRGGDSESEEASEITGPVRPPQRPADPQPQDRGAREIDEIPDQEAHRSAEDVNFLGELADAGIDVEGVADQLIGTATTVCGGGGNVLASATPRAVAGQLVQQGRTDKNVDEIAELIESAARDAYC